MKIIFLDIDGVLNDHRKLPGSHYCGICVERAGRLNRILEAVPEAKIIVTSAWRYVVLTGAMTLKGFEMLLLVSGVNCEGRLLGHTVADGPIELEPRHDDLDAWKTAGLKWRASQIRLEIEARRPHRYVVLDDLPLEGLENFIQTDPDIGLTLEQANRAIEILTPR